jgi:hypothetical protein
VLRNSSATLHALSTLHAVFETLMEMMNVHFCFNVAVLEEKSAALHALGTFAECVAASFGPYIEESLKMVVQLVDYFHDTVRDEAYTALAALLRATIVVYPAGATGLIHILTAYW